MSPLEAWFKSRWVSPPGSDEQVAPVVPNKEARVKTCKFDMKKNAWKHINASKEIERKQQKNIPPVTSFRLVTWNVDYQGKYVAERMDAALERLENEILEWEEDDTPEPCCILLQEVHRKAMTVLQESKFVRQHFLMTPATTEKWPAEELYGTVSLVQRYCMTVVEAKYISYGLSLYQRNALVTDVQMDAKSRTMRIVNTHLDSLQAGEQWRIEQMKICAHLLREAKGGIMAGDMNAISETDRLLPGDNGLTDACTVESSENMTWGIRGDEPYPPARMDKILYVSRSGYRVGPPKRVPESLEIEDEDEEVWMSDHFALTSIVKF